MHVRGAKEPYVEIPVKTTSEDSMETSTGIRIGIPMRVSTEG